MANSRQGGAFGFLKKSIGCVTYSTIKDGKGKRIQVARSKPTEVANPNTVAQILQRMKVKPAARFFKAFEEVLNNAFEGVAYGAASRRYFMGLAMSQTGPYIPKNATRFIPAKYPVSEGSLPAGFGVLYKKAENMSIPVATKTGFIYQLNEVEDFYDGSSIKVAAERTFGRGVQLTFLMVTQENDGSFVPHFGRLLTDEHDSGSGAVVNFDDFGVQYSGGSFYIADSTIDNAITQAQFQGVVAAACIVSVKEGDAWLRSNTSMVVNAALESNLYGSQASQAAVGSYQSATGSNSLNSTWYLNLANGQPFQGQLTLRETTLNYTVEEEPVDIDAVLPVGRTVSDNGYLRENIFADVSGNAIFNVNGQYTTIQNPEETTGTYIKAADIVMQVTGGSYVLTWKDSYAIQIQA